MMYQDPNRSIISSYFHFFFYFHLLLLPLVHSELLATPISSSTTTTTRSSSSTSTVRYLPGFPGPLPFHLETGYVGIREDDEQVELFYYFVKSERNPKVDPLVFWFAGGPRCSGLSALLFEIGPLKMDVARYSGGLPNLVLNPYSWTKVANIIFPDAPVYTGFSYSKSSPNLNIGDKESSKNSYEFVIKWLTGHPEFQANPLYIGGDSYSGKTVPIIVQDLLNDIEAHKYPFLNFKGYLLGNPITYRQLEMNSGVTFGYGVGLISFELFESMKENCKGNYLNFDLDNANCVHDRKVFDKCISKINREYILDKYCGPLKQKPKHWIRSRRSLSTMGEVIVSPEPDILIPGCRLYNQDLLSEYWTNDIRVQEAIHVKKGTVNEWIRCNYDIPYERDVYNIIEYHRNISTKLGYRSLIYMGDHDFWVPHISTEAWIRSLNLSIVDNWRPWIVDEQFAGYTRTYSSGLTYATVKGAGHIASEYKPKESFEMFQRWISDNSL